MLYSRTTILLVLTIFAASSQARDEGWPAYHGPRRDNLSPETGLMQSWPQDGPELLWTAEGIGHGYSSVTIAGGRIFTAGMIDRQTYVTALDLNGKRLWQRVNGQSWQATGQQPWAVPYSGSRGTPTLTGDTVYHLSEMGRLAALDAATGGEKWQVDVLTRFDAERPKCVDKSVSLRHRIGEMVRPRHLRQFDQSIRRADRRRSMLGNHRPQTAKRIVRIRQLIRRKLRHGALQR